MDLANLISYPAPETAPAFKLRAPYGGPSAVASPLKRSSEQFMGSYYTSGHRASYSHPSRRPPSPPVDQRKYSLPSISALLEGADSAAAHAPKRQRTSLSLHTELDSRRQSQTYDAGTPHNLPPSPPMRPGSGFRSNGHSPSASSTNNSVIKSIETYPITLPSPTDKSSVSSQGSVHHVSSGPYASPAPSVASYSSPIEPSPTSSAYYQRPTSSGTFPSVSPVSGVPSHPQMISPVTPAWQHHHYFPPSSSTPYQQNHDRYICRTCHKAFSRPSSLRIHSHSHTGEKPFRCTHSGCGKAFSVRSNMKRHERGCHTGRPVATAMVQ